MTEIIVLGRYACAAPFALAPVFVVFCKLKDTQYGF